MEAIAKLNNSPIAPRKMDLVARLIRNMSVSKALNVLKYESKHCATYIEKLLLSAVANWENKNETVKLEEVDLYVKSIQVGSAGMLKRFRPAPQGRAHRKKKKKSHITILVDGRVKTKPVSHTKENNTSEKIIQHGTKS